MKKATLYILLLAAVVLSISAADRNTRRKAAAIYLEAVDAAEDNRPDDAFMLLRHAAALDPDDPYIAATLAEYRLMAGTPDSMTIDECYRAIASRFHTNPADEHNALVYASLARSLGRLDDVIYIWETLDSIMPARTDPAMNLAASLVARYAKTVDRRDFDRAIDIYDRLEAATGPSVALASYKISAYSLLRDTTAIMDEISRLAASAPADAQTNMLAGRLYNSIGMPDSALRYLDKAEMLDPADGKIYLARAAVYQARNDSAAYDREVFRALQAPAVDYQDKYQLLSDYVVKLYSDSLQRPRIEQMFETIQDVNPGEATLHALYGAYKASIEDNDAAIEQFNYSIELDPSQHGVWQNLFSIYSLAKRDADIDALAERALTIFPGDPLFSLSAAYALLKEKKYARALGLLDKVNMDEVDKDQVVSLIESTRGDIFYAMEQPDSAYAAYQRAIEANPQNYMALNNSAYHMAQSGQNLSTAEIYASIATASDPDNITFLDTQAWVAYKKHDYEKARTVIDHAIEILEAPDAKPSGPEAADVYSHAGDIYYMIGDADRAVELWKQALKYAPSDQSLLTRIKNKKIADQ